MITPAELLDAIRSRDIKCTLLSIGPMSGMVIKAALELGRDLDFPVFFIASRNQIECQELGGGYVMNMNTYEYADYIKSTAMEAGFEGIYYLCRDHGGPWQQDAAEYKKKIPLDEAMERGIQSYIEDIKAGFHLLHIDPTKDPHTEGAVPLDEVIKRNIIIIKALEEERKKLALPPVSYEIGTEETKGGIIDPAAFRQFLEAFLKEAEQNSLPLPAFIVGQTGCLIEMRDNPTEFQPEVTRELAAIAQEYNIGFKEHNTDHMTIEELEMHPELGVTGANCAPGFGASETDALLTLDRAAGMGEFTRITTRLVMETGKWEKWLYSHQKHLTRADIENDPALLRDVVVVNGHYVFEHPEFQDARKRLYDFIGDSIDAERFVLDNIKVYINRYVKPFRMKGLTTKILQRD